MGKRHEIKRDKSSPYPSLPLGDARYPDARYGRAGQHRRNHERNHRRELRWIAGHVAQPHGKENPSP